MKAGKQGSRFFKHDFRLYKNMPPHILPGHGINIMTIDEELYSILSESATREEKIKKVNIFYNELYDWQKSAFNSMKKEGYIAKNLHFHNTQNTTMIGVIALSKDLQNEAVNNIETLHRIDEVVLSFCEDFSKLFGVELIYVVRHDDEKAINYHFCITNLRIAPDVKVAPRFGLSEDLIEKIRKGIGKTMTATFTKNVYAVREYQFKFAVLQDLFYNYIEINFPNLHIERGKRRIERKREGEDWVRYHHIPLSVLKNSPSLSERLLRCYKQYGK